MRQDRNHEGYHDPTACLAIKRISGHLKEKGKDYHLTYEIRETRSFQEAKTIMERG